MNELQKLQVSEQPEITGATAVYPWDAKLAKQFTVRSRFDEEVVLYERLGEGAILLPRGVCPLGKIDRRVTRPAAHPFTSTFKPRNSEQARVVAEAASLMTDGESFILQATTGFGKTAVACELIAWSRQKTLVIVPKEDLMYGKGQWRDSLKKFLGLPEEQIGLIRQNKERVEGCQVVLGMLQSLAKPGRYSKVLRQEFGLVIWDEVHRVPAPTFMATASYFPAKLRLGLSATPYRRDGKDIVVQANIGPVRVTSKLLSMKPLVSRYRSSWRCPRRGGRQVPHSATKAGHILNHLVRHQGRNRLLTHLIVKAAEAKRITVVFSDRVAHLEALRSAAVNAGVPISNTALYISGLNDKQREVARGKDVIFATYGMMAEGTDIPWLDVCILATPRSNIEQPIGRVLREYPNKPQPVVVDITDDDSPVYEGFGRGRLSHYHKIRAEVRSY